MDRLTAFVAISHLKLRLQYLSRHPELIKETSMTPTFKGLGGALAKLKHDLDLQAQPLMADIESLASEAPGLLKQAVQEVAKTKQAVADIKDYVSGLLESNGGPILTASPPMSAASPAPATSIAAPAGAPTVASG